eukprot:14017351-Alexandrium_andersonii.AAC.1
MGASGNPEPACAPARLPGACLSDPSPCLSLPLPVLLCTAQPLPASVSQAAQAAQTRCRHAVLQALQIPNAPATQ